MSIDLSRLPAPNVIEALSYEAMLAAARDRFMAAWADARALDPSLPAYDVELLETDPAQIVLQAITYQRLLDRARVNDAARAVLAPFARGADLDAVAARVGVQRLVVTPASGATPAVIESDASLLRRYLLAFDRPSAGSPDSYLFLAYTAWPLMHDAAVRGFDVHGRRGDVDLVVIGPDGRAATSAEIATVQSAIMAMRPEATSPAVIPAIRNVYDVSLVIEVPTGPDPALVRAEAEARIRSFARSRMTIGGEVPLSALLGAAYGPSVLTARSLAPTADIARDLYAVPILGELEITTEIRS